MTDIKTNKSGNDTYQKWNCKIIRYDWVDKNICIFENLVKVIFLAWNTANAKVYLLYMLCDAVETSFYKYVLKYSKPTLLFIYSKPRLIRIRLLRIFAKTG